MPIVSTPRASLVSLALAAAAAFAQRPRLRVVKVGRCANRGVWTMDLTPVATNSTAWCRWYGRGTTVQC